MFPRQTGVRSRGVVTVPSLTISDAVAAPATALAGFRVTSAGLFQQKIGTGGSYTTIGSSGFTSFVNGADWEVKAVLNSGSVDTGTTGSLLSLSSNQTWDVTVASGVQSADLTIEIYPVGASSPYASGNVVLDGDSS